MSNSNIKVRLLVEDALQVDVDILALKFAQANYGLDKKVSSILSNAGTDPSVMRPWKGGFRIVDTTPGIKAQKVLFIGVVPLIEFEYAEIREFSRRVLSSLAGEAPETKRIGLTLHGAGYGLDENEAFEAEIAGLVDAVQSQDFPRNLTEILIVETNKGRAFRLEKVLQQLLPGGSITLPGSQSDARSPESIERLRSAGYASASKNHIFVAMPFKDEMDDVYHYGIQAAVRKAGFLCERADLSSFSGDVMNWVRERIKTAKLVVADLTEANPNVYLEVGYAWGCEIPTVLVIKDTDDLKFDTRGQRCLSYKRIKDLEDSLTKELQALNHE